MTRETNTRSAPDLTLSEVASELAVHYDTVLAEVHRGNLDGYRIAGRWRVTREALDAYKAANGPTT